MNEGIVPVLLVDQERIGWIAMSSTGSVSVIYRDHQIPNRLADKEML